MAGRSCSLALSLSILGWHERASDVGWVCFLIICLQAVHEKEMASAVLTSGSHLTVGFKDNKARSSITTDGQSITGLCILDISPC